MKNTNSRIINARFLIRTITATGITLLLIFLLTMPAIMKPYYQSEAVGFAPPLLQSDGKFSNPGDDRVTDIYMQILRSTIVADSLNRKFKLMERFGIDSRAGQAKSRMLKELDSRLKVQKTRYGSVSVRVLDHDPEIAADMANNVLKFGDRIQNSIMNQQDGTLNEKQISGAYIVRSAVPAHKPEIPDRSLLMMLGAGLVLFVLIAFEIIRYNADSEKKNP